MPDRKPTPDRRINLQPAHKLCLSCQNSQVSTAQSQLRIYCAAGHRSASADCPDYAGNGHQALLNAIKQRIRETQLNYRGRFNILQPDCHNCVQNCCTTPFLDRTPFYPEDALYYLLSDQPLPNISKSLKHCMFFNQGCTLPADLRPHVCIEYKCLYQHDAPLSEMGQFINYATIDLLAVVTGDYTGWRGEYTIENRPALKQRGFAAGKTFDRFDREWDPAFPTRDLYAIYDIRYSPDNHMRG
jgi:hypothetical protein